ncbi:MAG: hypothetical protein K6E81_05180 [Lachnospiraceae bacterium]|nr:hypothetical protein [Lachnospiraceae bacterium]
MRNTKKNKADLIEDLLERLETQETELKDFVWKYDKELALYPSDLQETLACSKTERLKWSEDGRLMIVQYKEDRIYRKGLKIPLYSLYQVFFEISKETLKEWRKEDKDRTKQNRREGAKKAKATKEERKQVREEAKISYENMVDVWSKIDEEAKAVGELAFWTMWENRLAKKEQLKATNEKNNSHTISKKKYYDNKEKALRLLSRSKYTDITIYVPENPDKTQRIYYENDYDEFEYDEYYGAVSEYDTVIVEEDYYTLYYICISIGENTFKFHVPYNIGKQYLPDKSRLEHVNHRENDGIFRFGREISDEELIVYTEKKALGKHMML